MPYREGGAVEVQDADAGQENQQQQEQPVKILNQSPIKHVYPLNSKWVKPPHFPADRVTAWYPDSAHPAGLIGLGDLLAPQVGLDQLTGDRCRRTASVSAIFNQHR
jgi:hypothetical protein